MWNTANFSIKIEKHFQAKNSGEMTKIFLWNFTRRKDENYFQTVKITEKHHYLVGVLACFCSTWNGRSKSNCSTWNIWRFKRFSAFSLRYCVFYCLFLRICVSSVLRVECCCFCISFVCFYHAISPINSPFRQWLVCSEFQLHI